MSSDFIPSRDADLDFWLNNFQTLVAANPTNYGLVAGDATSLTNSYNDWHSAYLAATNATTRNHITIAAKDAQKIITVDVFRTYSNTIRANTGVSDTLKLGLGLNVHDTIPTPIPPPSTYPVLGITGAGPLMQDLRAADQLTPTRRAKPHGSTGMLVFRALGTEAITDPTQAPFLGFVTRAEFVSNFDAADDGKIATYFARWTNGKGEMGPWSSPVSMRVAA
jgi:hypothetical protein